MDLFKTKAQGASASFFLGFILMMVWYAFYLIHSDSYFISIWGDGFKNYFTFAYYVNFDHGSHFTGMNYPFGEHVVFTDDQPALAFIFSFLAHIDFIKEHLHSIFTIGTFLSLPICAAIIFLILAEYEAAGIYTVVSAVFITMLSPQIIRLSGHFGMCYCFFIPLAILLLIRASHTGRGVYLLFLSVAITLFGLIHIYNLAIISFFALAYSCIYFLTAAKSRSNTIFFIKHLAAAILPFLIIKAFMLLTDSVTDRPDNPWGFFDTCSSLDTVFLIPFSFMYQFLSHYTSMQAAADERWSYIGIVADLVLTLIMVVSIFRLSLTRRIFRGLPLSLPVAFVASVVLLLFSFGLPFSTDAFRWLFDYMGPIRQFRAPCRFAWVFYYMANIFSVVYVSRLLLAFGIRTWLKIVLAIALFALWFIDLNVYNNGIARNFSQFRRQVDMKGEKQQIKNLLAEKKLSLSDFQALFCLPYFTSGSEKTLISTGVDVLSMRIALYTGLKMIDAEMSRTSLSQANMNLQLVSSSLIKKEVLKLYPSRLPLLMAVDTNADLAYTERSLVDKSSLIGLVKIDGQPLRLYILPLSAFDDSVDRVSSGFEHMLATMHRHNNYMSTDTADDVVVNTYDSLNVPFYRFGKGALYKESESVTLFAGKIPAAKDSGLYEFSIWNYGDHRVPAYPWYHVTVYDAKMSPVAQYDRLGHGSRDVFENWKRIDLQFVLPCRDCTVKIDAGGTFATYDEFMIRQVSTEVLTHYNDPKLFMYNNYPILK